MRNFLLILISFTFYLSADLKVSLDQELKTLMPKVIEWRHDIHEHPELGNREFRTSNKVKVHLEGLGIKVESGIAYTGVVGLIEGGKPGPTIALRADMDALPVEEKLGTFCIKSKDKIYSEMMWELCMLVGMMHMLLF